MNQRPVNTLNYWVLGAVWRAAISECQQAGYGRQPSAVPPHLTLHDHEKSRRTALAGHRPAMCVTNAADSLVGRLDLRRYDNPRCGAQRWSAHRLTRSPEIEAYHKRVCGVCDAHGRAM